MITTVTLNASIDKAYHMEASIQDGTVMRVKKCSNSAGGKGLNVARIVKLCGEQVKATGFAGGYNGKYLEALLEEDRIAHDFDHVAGETRSCINILDDAYGSTEYLEPGRRITEEEKKRFFERFPDIIRDSRVVTLSGSVPEGSGKDVYQRLTRIAKDMGKQVILDTSGELLAEGLKALPDMVKPNRDEIEALFHTKIAGTDDVIRCAKHIHGQGIPYVVISLGGDGALLVCDGGTYQGKPPKVEAVNTVGCGDSMVGAFAVAMERDYEPEEALRFAVAVAAANALSPDTGNFQPSVYQALLENVTVERLDA